MSPEAITTIVTADENMPAWAIRLEGKVDLVVAQQTQRLNNHETEIADHETRLRGIERDMPHDAHARLRAVEERKAVSPIQLWTAVCTGCGALASLTAVLTFILNK